MRTTLIRAAFVVAGCCLASACGTSTEPRVNLIAVDTLIAEMNTAATLGGPASAAAGVPLTEVAPTPAICPYNASSQRFVCPPVQSNGFIYSRYFQLLDASDAPLSVFDTKVVVLRVVTDVSGGRTTQGGTVTLSSHDDARLSGLHSDVHTINSTGTSTNTVTTTSGQTFSFKVTQTTSNLVLPKRGSGGKYPQSGTITMNVTAGPQGSVGAISTITMTFDGTSIAKWTVVTGAMTQTCSIDMGNPSATPVCK